MRHREVRELMTREVVTVARNATFKDIVRTLGEHAVSAVAVTDTVGRPLGVISEGDLLPKPADQGDWFGSLPRPEPWESEKAAGTSAEELMSAPPVCARPDWTVAEAARLMESQRVKRLLVVDESDVLVGIVTRGDLLRIFLRDDAAIRHEIYGEVLARTLRLDPSSVSVDVTDGQVTLHGVVRFRSLVPVVERLCRTVDGVVRVDVHLAWETDDTGTGR
ncbi:CBS domain-containing protein [Streptomyces yangpuensis]|uniref:CBS domain-containing protein n=1 Tax=Streptomyces yangpuensis TaxID=1648182 RepID=UPI0006292651|nr:CBS domain-containing protein [Streptomyces yangpuensis]